MNPDRPGWRVLLTALIAVGGGCGGTTVASECEVPGAVNLVVTTEERLNPDPDGRALPTVLRLFQLAELSGVETASFEELWRDAEQVLGESVVGADELTVYPARRLERRFERNPDANYLLAMGLFRRPGGTSWRAILELPPPPEEQECAARAELDDDEEVPEFVDPRVELFMDDYRIEGTLTLEPAGRGCVGFGCDLEDVADGAGQQAQEAAETEAGAAAEGAAGEAAEAAPSAPGVGVPAPKGFEGLVPSRAAGTPVRRNR